MILLPFGGITIFNERIDKPLYQEFIIAILGPLFQFIFYNFFKQNELFKIYNEAILFFNLLPIYPLDGSKILNVFLNSIISFKFSHIITILVSIMIIIFLLINNRNLILFIILLFIIFEIMREINKHNYYFNKFLLERYLYNNHYKKIKYIKNIKQMKKQTNHVLISKNKIINEDSFIKSYFDKLKNK